jgi:hypothetical protein
MRAPTVSQLIHQVPCGIKVGAIFDRLFRPKEKEHRYSQDIFAIARRPATPHGHSVRGRSVRGSCALSYSSPYL